MPTTSTNSAATGSAGAVRTLTEVTEPIEVTITFDGSLIPIVDKTFIRVAEETTVTIVWTIVQSNLPDVQIAFDNPALTLFGGSDSIPRATPTTVSLDWTNMPSQQGLSFFYRLHMFAVTLSAQSENPDYHTITHDPTIHNDPPSSS